MKFLLIQTQDKRQLITKYSHLPVLKEFIENFKVEVFTLKANSDIPYLEINKLATAICDPNFTMKPHGTIISKIQPKYDRTMLLKQAAEIKAFIQKTLLSGNVISLKHLKEKYKNFDFTDACLCNHLSIVRKDLESTGKIIKKIGAGKYCLAKN